MRFARQRQLTPMRPGCAPILQSPGEVAHVGNMDLIGLKLQDFQKHVVQRVVDFRDFRFGQEQLVGDQRQDVAVVRLYPPGK